MEEDRKENLTSQAIQEKLNSAEMKMIFQMFLPTYWRNEWENILTGQAGPFREWWEVQPLKKITKLKMKTLPDYKGPFNTG